MQNSRAIAVCYALGVLAMISFFVDWHNLANSGSIDLRNRITGVRLMAEGIDPFHYKWHAGDPEKYCDPFNNLAVPVSKTTVTPAFLLTHLPLGWLPYRPAQYLWLIAQWLMLAGVGWIWWRALADKRKSLAFALMLVGFTFTPAWRLHAERGQCYVMLALLLAGWVVLSRDGRRALWAGVLAGFLVALRPPLLLALAPFMLLRRSAQIPGTALGLILGAGLPMLLDASCWTDYASAMQSWSELYRSGSNPRPPGQVFPETIEGMSIDQLGGFAVIPFADSSIFYLLRRWGITNVPAVPVLAVFGVLLVVWYWRVRGKSVDEILLGIAAWAFVLDFFLPALRNTYNDVLILNAVALGLLLIRRPVWLAWLPLLVLCAGLLVYGKMPKNPWVINTPTFAFLLFAVLCLLAPGLPRWIGMETRRKESAA